LKRSNRLILLIGVLLAAMAFVGVIMLTGSSSPGGGTPTITPKPTTAKVVKATIDIAAGTNVTASMVELNDVQIAAAGPDTIPDTGLAIGKTIRRAVTKGQTLGYSFFVSTGVENNVTDALPIGLRAMAIQVSQVTGVGTLIQNGDHVDVIISLKIQNVIPDPKNPGQIIKVGDPGPSVKLILQNALVVGTLLPPAAAPTAQPSPTPAPSGQTSGGGQQPATSLNGQSEMVMVAVSANQAEVIRYAQRPATTSRSSSARPGTTSRWTRTANRSWTRAGTRSSWCRRWRRPTGSPSRPSSTSTWSFRRTSSTSRSPSVAIGA
jgi:Flp pilus assembly protein CpaB